MGFVGLHRKELYGIFNSNPAKKEILLHKSGMLIIFVFHQKFESLVKNWSLFSKPTSFSIKKVGRERIECWKHQLVSSLETVCNL